MTPTKSAVTRRDDEPFHFSPRYALEQERMLAEVTTAFENPTPDAKT